MQLQQRRRRRTKEAVHEMAERHREIVDNAIDIIYTADLDGRFTSVNRAGERLTGYTEDEARKMDLTRVVAPEYLALARQMLVRKLAGGGPTTYELEIMTKNGQRVPLEVSSQLIVRRGKPVGIQGIGRNITKRKLAEAENHRRAILMGRLIGLTETLNQPLTEGELVKAIGRGALILSEASRALLVFRQADGTVACPWSQGISSAYVTQVLIHLRDLPAGLWMSNAYDDVVGQPGSGLGHGMPPVLLSDGEAQPSELMSKLVPAEGSRAAAIWPLTSEGRTIGLMACHYDSPRAWSQPELDVLHVFFRQAGAALENVRLYEARAQRTAELEALLDLSKRLRAAHSLEEMYPLLVEHSRRLLRADHSTLAFLEPHRDALTRVHSAGLPSIGHGAIIPIQGTLLGRVVQTGAPLRIDAAADESDPELSGTGPDHDLGGVVVMPIRSEDEIIGALAVGRARGPESRPFTEADVSVLQGIAEIGGTAIQRARLDRNLEQAYVQMVLALAHSTAPRDSHTALQNFHLMTLAEEMGRAVGVGDDVIEDIRWGARLHDIGKVGVPDSIVHKRGPLTERERAVLLRHPVIGEEILARVARMRGVAKLVRHHQEHWDGTGYPDGLRGEEIPKGARILSVVDAYRGLLEAAHMPPRTHDEAVAEIRRSAGTRFDPMIVDVFSQTVERVRSMDEPVA